MELLQPASVSQRMRKMSDGTLQLIPGVLKLTGKPILQFKHNRGSSILIIHKVTFLIIKFTHRYLLKNLLYFQHELPKPNRPRGFLTLTVVNMKTMRVESMRSLENINARIADFFREKLNTRVKKVEIENANIKLVNPLWFKNI